MKISIPFLIVSCWTIAFSGSITPLMAQTGERCGTATRAELFADPGHQKVQSAFEARVWAWVDGQKRNRTAAATYTIPTVIHVIQQGSTDLIPDACLHSQIDVLNQDFQKLNADTNLVPAEFLSALGNGSIEFCLATRDPNGNPTTGITRTVSPQWANHSKSQEDSLKALIQWPPTQYINIWVPATMSGGLLGYATFPTKLASEPHRDGVVINGQYMGSGSSCALSPYDKGRTATHEVGHWLGLFHTFEGSGCQGTTASTCAVAGDNICDTPPVTGSTFGCPGQKNTCTETPNDLNDQTMNYMDYVDDACMYMFTAGQVDRMHAVLNMERSVISSPANHSATGCGCSIQSPCAPQANFGADRLSICPGQSVAFSDLSTGPGTNWSWSFPGGTPSSSAQQNPTILYASPGAYNVTLTVINTLGTDTYTANAYVTVAQGTPPPMTEGFESSLPADWQIENADNASTWVITSQAASLGLQSVFIDNWNYDAQGTADAVVSRIVDLSNYGSGELTFDYAYQQTLFDHDTLKVYLSSDCGQSWDLVWEKGGPGLATAPGAGITMGFVPSGPSDWKTDTLDVAGYLGSSGFKVKFECLGHEGNTLWLDNINLTGVVSRQDALNRPDWSLEVAPNPFRDELAVNYTVENKTRITFTLTDLSGKVIHSLETGWKAPGVHSLEWPGEMIPQLPAGIYFLRGTSTKGAVTRKLVKIQ